jgi:hypothetical protein
VWVQVVVWLWVVEVLLLARVLLLMLLLWLLTPELLLLWLYALGLMLLWQLLLWLYILLKEELSFLKIITFSELVCIFLSCLIKYHPGTEFFPRLKISTLYCYILCKDAHGYKECL